MAERKYDYEKYLSSSKRLNNFLDLYKDRTATCRAYKRHLVKYFSEMGIEDVDNYVKDTRQLDKKEKIEYLDGIERDLRKYWIKLNKETRGKTPYVWLSAIKMFLIMNKSLELDDVYISLQKSGHGNYAITDAKTPTKEELLKIFSYSNPESKALFMFQLTSGQRIEQVMETTFDNIDMKRDCPRIYYPQAKQKYWVKTRITPEAKKILQDYLEQKDKFIKVREKRGEYNRMKELDKDRLFCMNVSTANHMWTVMVKNAGLYKLDSKTGRPHYGTHCLRRYFLTHFGDETWGDFFSGHITARNKEYRKYSDEKLDQEYIKHKDDLNIFETTPDLTGINESLKKKDREIIDLKQEMDRIRMELLEVKMRQVQELQRENLGKIQTDERKKRDNK